ncbi:hypothetical protein QTP70_011832 [Hemibagrus guttatus]|uniref:ribonuclease H n=1 Tax=Hemibagrus guttatus TaxID=175788 RepID=A0AAE0VAY7_9TELE|nr:hypothetical protein QTP70_011832 [Hemibagrus guttatus]
MALRTVFRGGLNSTLQAEMVCREMGTSLSEYITTANRLGNLLRQRRRFPAPHLEQQSGATVRTEEHSREESEPMQLGHAHTAPEERQCRELLLLCFHCGGSGHQYATYPERKPRPQVSATRTNSCFVLLVMLHSDCLSRVFPALVDSGAAVNLIDQRLVEKLRLPIRLCRTPLKVTAMDNQPIREGLNTQITTPLTLQVGMLHIKETPFCAITVHYPYPPALVPIALEQLREAKIFTKLDLCSAYNLVRNRKGNEWNTAFHTTNGHYEYRAYNLVRNRKGNEWNTAFHTTNGHYEYLVMPYSLRDMIGRYVIAYIDDILIYSASYDKHVGHVRTVLACLLQNQLFVKVEKLGRQIDAVTEKVDSIDARVVNLEKENAMLRDKYEEFDAYKRRQNLRVAGVEEQTEENLSPTQLHTSATPHPPPLTPLTIKEEEVNRLFKRLNTRKATGPDSISPSLLKHCANQLSPVFTDIFNTSLETCHVPACFKTSAIVPVPKKTKITGLNDYRPVALTSVVMKSFERLVLSYLKDITDPLLDPLQFAYRANRSVDDAVNMALHFILQHLDSPGSYARILFVDFSSAFNTIIPALLRDKLFQLNVPDSMCSWITDFLTDRRQFVRLGTHVSDLQHISTGSPQGCVLSPLLFSLYTNGCTSGHQSVKLLKFADDTTLIGLISDGNESAYRGEIDRLVSWCSTNNLELNSLKTVEMTVDFRKDPAPRPPVILCDSPVSSAESFCFLGTTITKELKWAQNISYLTKKAQQRMYFLRQLKKFLLPVKMLVNFYTAIIESVLTSSITVWFAAATARDKAKLQRVIHSAEKVIGCSLPSLQELYFSRSRRRAAKIAADPSHPGNELFRSLPSGKRLRSIKTRTSRHKNSFFPTAVSLLNSAPLAPR